MTMPWNYRPEPDTDGNVMQWEDTAISNSMAWLSDTLMPKWCKTVDHWTSKAFEHIWAECGCCLFFRGVSVGVLIGFTVTSIALLLT